MSSITNILYASAGDALLQLDLYLPDGVAHPPLVMFIHGGGWRNGSRQQRPPRWIADSGYALACIDYRLTDRATFPAQLFDCKGALRWLRANHAKFGYAAERVGVAGTSAGAHLAVLMGTTGGVPDLEGAVGGNPDYSSRVQAVVDFCGPSDFILRAETQPSKTEPPDSPVHRLLGGPVRGNEAAARRASGAWHVHRDAAPLLIFQGADDATVLPSQSTRLRDAYLQHGCDVEMHLVPGVAHNSNALMTEENRQRVIHFLDRHLRQSAP